MFWRATLVGLMAASFAHADNWPAWRGPGHQGISAETKLPVTWSKNQNIRWKTRIPGNGVSQPVVWQDHIFLTGSEGRLNEELHVYCYRASDGKQLWHTRLFGSAPTDLYAPGGMAVPTAATDGKLVFVLFGSGDLAALDFEGRPVWIRSLADEYGPFRNRWGMGSSPILLGNLLLVQVDHWAQSYLLGIEPQSGKNRWKTNRPGQVNWTSPVPVIVKGRVEILTLGTHVARGYDPGNGAELWQFEGFSNQCIACPVAADGFAYFCSSDTTMAMKLDGATGELTKSHMAWKNKKINTFITSPLLYQGQLYVTSDKGFVSCIDGPKGKTLWRERLGDSFHASPVAGAGMIYFPSKEGMVRVIKAGAEYEVLAENDIGETLVASPALSNGRIYLRGEKHLFCVE